MKEGLLVLFIAIAHFKQYFIEPGGSDSQTALPADRSQLASSHAAEMPQEKQKPDVLKVGEQPKSGKDTYGEGGLMQCQLSAEWKEATLKQRAVVLQNMTNKVAYNGHVGRIKNCTKSRLLVAVHGVYFNADPVNIWVKQWHVRPLDPLTPVPIINVDQVSVRASSTRKDFPLHVVLEEDDSKWWISAPGSFSRGRGEEYLEFEFASLSALRVLGISIPPMPMGPLSVREFSVEAFVDKRWQSVSPRLQTLDRVGLQEVALESVETHRLRVKCFATAAPMDSVGLFQISFL